MDFLRNSLTSNDINTYYYYPLSDYNASYDSVVMQNDATTYDDIYKYVNGQSYDLKQAFYTALGRERIGKYNNAMFTHTGINANDITAGLPEESLPEDTTTENKTKYRIRYDLNSGIGILPDTTGEFGETKYIDSTIPTRVGHEFLGWSEDKEATEPTYQGGDKLVLKKNYTLYAVWKANNLVISYNGNGGTGVPTAQTGKYGQSITLSGVTPTRATYTFLGWSKNSSATEATYQPGEVIDNLEESMVLYAVWELNEYRVTYDANGGTGAPESYTWKQGETLKISSVVPTKEAYTFAGWNTDKDATESQYYLGQVLTNQSGDMTLYAIWKLNEYTITFDANGGTGAPSAQTKAHGAALTLSTTQPTRSGYTFQGWATTSSATSAQYQAGGTYTENGDATLYAVWKLRTYTIKYNANGGTGAPTSQTKTHGVNITLSTTKPTRDGYDFLGWATSSSATSATYQPGVTYTANSGVTLYAVWNAHTYTISYNANGGSGAASSQTKTHGTTLTLSTTKPTRTGYTFQGWATSSSATSAQYQAGGSYTTEGNATLYAVWSVSTYTIKYSANGGSGAPSAQTGTYGTDITLSTTKPTREGYNFLGWATTVSATSSQYQAGGKYRINGDATLYAVWGGLTYTVIYDANGGTGAPNSQTWSYGEQLKLSLTQPTRDGYTFLGWNTDKNATESQHYPGKVLDNQYGDMTLYAVWKINKYTITYNANGGSGAPSSQTKTHGTTLTLSSTIPTRTGYTFKGWATTASATSAQYQPGGAYAINANLSLYAVWQINTYTLTYDANGGSGAPNSQTWVYGEQIQLSTTQPTRNGYTFLGWNTDKNATESQHYPGKVLDNQYGDMTLYAVWQINTYTITYNANGGSGAPNPQTKTHGINLILSSTVPTRTMHSFLGWSISSSATSAQYQPGGTYSLDGNVTLYAVWKVVLPSTDYTKPYMPDGYDYVEGDLDSGIVIEDSLGNEFVWIEVPKTTTVYPTTGTNLGVAFGDSYFKTIENDLHTYTSTYRNSTSASDVYAQSTGGNSFTGLTSTQYTQLYKSMLRSIYNNGGFYIGRYETGVTTPRTSSASTLPTPVIRRHAYPYIFTYISQAQTLSSSFADSLSGYETSLMFGVQWDLVLKYLESKGVSQYYLTTDSTTWGNHYNTSCTITISGPKYKNVSQGYTTITPPYTRTSNTHTMFTTGATDKFKKMNIYDFAGNVWEYTLEYTGNLSNPVVRRGGGWNSSGSYSPVSARGSQSIGGNDQTAFRVMLFKTSLY